MNGFMKLLVLASLIGFACNGLCDCSTELDSGIKLGVGGDLRVRWETIDREVISPDGNLPDGPGLQYLRVRTRLWGSVELPDSGVKLFARFANRSQYYSSNTSDPNNDGMSTWEFPDETVLDALNLTLGGLFERDLSLVIGRQDLILGSGMWMAEGAPFVQARSLYHDGITLKWKGDATQAVLFSFYDTWKDGSVFINDRNRHVRTGNIFTAGGFLSHEFSKAATLELYYMFNDIEDKGWESLRNHPADNSNSLHTAGFRLYGRPFHAMSYSFELAKQAGVREDGGANQGTMIDARVRWFAPEETMLKPEFGLQYLYLSGDENGTGNNEGWIPVMSEYPIIREELMAVTLNGNWTNLHMQRAELVLNLTEALKLTLVSAFLQADTTRTDLCSGGEPNMGTMLSSFVDYKFNDSLSFAAEIAQFTPGDFFSNGHSSVWSRLQVLYKF